MKLHIGLLLFSSLGSGEQQEMHYMDSLSSQVTSTIGPLPCYFTQKQDHFDEKNKNEWQQAYYVNATFWEGAESGAPVFLCVGGEGPPLDGSVVVSSPHCNVAVEWLQETKALMFAVEHRYYGCHNRTACPYSKSTEKPLQYLSSRQAIEDLATFHAYASNKYNLSAANKWVSFGGSYPGMLAGWFRVKHPELVHASVASSAPVVAVLDMTGYNDVTAEAYAVNSVGGSETCRQAIGIGHAKIGEMMNTTQGREKLAKQFKVNAASLTTHAGKLSFAGNGVTYFPSQSNDPACTQAACNIEKICNIMTNTSIGNEVDRLANLRATQRAANIVKSIEENEFDRRKTFLSHKFVGISDQWSDETIDYWLVYLLQQI